MIQLPQKPTCEQLASAETDRKNKQQLSGMDRAFQREPRTFYSLFKTRDIPSILTKEDISPTEAWGFKWLRPQSIEPRSHMQAEHSSTV